MKRFESFAFSILMILSLTAFFANPTYGLDEEAVRVAVIDTGISSAAISAENLAEGQN